MYCSVHMPRKVSCTAQYMSPPGMPPPPIMGFFSSGASTITHSEVVIMLDTLAASVRAVRTTWGGARAEGQG